MDIVESNLNVLEAKEDDVAVFFDTMNDIVMCTSTSKSKRLIMRMDLTLKTVRNLLHKIPKSKGVMALNNQHPKHPKTNWFGEKKY